MFISKIAAFRYSFGEICGLGLLAEALVLRRYMRTLLQERNRVVKETAESSDWQRYLPGGAACEL